jgi:hypothetical protein
MPTVAYRVAVFHSRASTPSKGTRRDLTRVLNTGPVTNHAALGRAPQARKLRQRASESGDPLSAGRGVAWQPCVANIKGTRKTCRVSPPGLE